MDTTGTLGNSYGPPTGGPYLEMFARRPYPGWTTWGNEVTKRDIRLDCFDALVELS